MALRNVLMLRRIAEQSGAALSDRLEARTCDAPGIRAGGAGFEVNWHALC